MIQIQDDWKVLLEEEFAKPYYLKLMTTLEEEYQTKVVYPNRADLFTALQATSYANTKVVILGQDPYHGAGQAHGLSFSVQPGVPLPPSLKNIFIELQSDVDFNIPNHGCLHSWAEQGVLLLNTVMTVRAGEANSHKKIGWQQFTNLIISLLNARVNPVVFILWGNGAQQKTELITNPKHLVIQSVHPSPLSSYRGFFGSKPFSAANRFLRQNGSALIDWQLPMDAY
ncbi:uracil-DNA glycosylase [Paenibacillus psychroresistens]|uniref:Uracil-DNA glycosylase n=1 Tax=Paenibacillus psychroresistens TaxID=1778678 RepID=A0A6B8RI61_9BACL|nr:uracil-DNA glycosylase [Paenibacillus psychroresistens]QGQ95242.1 uracil-DNA glycosylase [Paenibacillus psychroresistens]